MKRFIKNKLSETLFNKNLNTICNKMSIKTYEDGINLLKSAIGSPESNPTEWKKIEKPLNMWRLYTNQIRKELSSGMTGDSEVDESNTWWSAIIGTLCK